MKNQHIFISNKTCLIFLPSLTWQLKQVQKFMQVMWHQTWECCIDHHIGLEHKADKKFKYMKPKFHSKKPEIIKRALLSWACHVSKIHKQTWVIFGAKTIAMLRAFILLRCSCWTTSAIKLMAQSSRAASIGGRSLTSAAQSSSVWHCITCSGDKESRTPVGSSLNQAYRIEHIS